MTEQTSDNPANPTRVGARIDNRTRPYTPFLAGFVGGVIAMACVTAAAAFYFPQWRSLILGPVDERLAALETASAEQANLLRTPAPAPSASADAAKSGDTASATVPGNVESRLSQVEADVAGLHRAMPDQGTLLRLAESAQAGEKTAHDIVHQHATSQALLLAAGQLRDAVDRGAPFDAELQASVTLAGDDAKQTLDTLAPYAGTGIPTRDKLITAFPALADIALRAQLLPPGDGFWRHVLARLSTVVSVRRIDGRGSDTTAVLGRAEQDVHAGDLTAAITELSTLSGPAADATASWVHDASARTAADRALSRLTSLVAAITAKNGE